MVKKNDLGSFKKGNPKGWQHPITQQSCSMVENSEVASRNQTSRDLKPRKP